MINLKTKEKLMVQKGISSYKFKYSKAEIFKEIPFDQMIQHLGKARVVISHAGPATIFLSSKYSKNKPLVVPRKKEFGEHTDNHQQYYIKSLIRKKLVKGVLSKENLTFQIISYLNQPIAITNKKRLKSPSYLVQNLIKYTENI